MTFSKLLKLNEKAKLIIFTFVFIICLTPSIPNLGVEAFPSWLALLLGIVMASLNIIPTSINTGKYTKTLLSYSIVGLGFGITIEQAINVCSNGLGLIIGSITFTLVAGFIVSKFFSINNKTSILISSGTAICGGSAIAAVAPAIKAKDKEISIALATIFTLNALALIIFPIIGKLLTMTDFQFGVWSAIAIHDTSSVVGAAATYSESALQTATTIKLARALFIVPIALFFSFLFSGNSKKIRVPLFIVLYIIALLISSYIKFDFVIFNSEQVYEAIYSISKRTLVGALFLIGCSITLSKLKKSGLKPMLFGSLLWFLIGSLSLLYIYNYM